MSKKISLFISFFIIFVFALLTRLYLLSVPQDFVFDERYHVPAIWLIADNDIRAFEWWHGPIYGESNHDWLHPPLAKYLQAASILIGRDVFGQLDAYYWRLPSVIFGVLGIAMVAYLAWLMFKNVRVALLSALLLSLDGLWLVMSRAAMNDIFLSVWLLGAITSYVLYLQEKKLGYLIGVGSALGLALATKWTAGLMILGILAFEIGRLVEKYQGKRKFWLRFSQRLPWLIFTLILIPLVLYLFSYLPVFLQKNGVDRFIGLQRNVIGYQLGRQTGHISASKPWQWLINDGPVWFWGDSLLKFRADIIASGNPLAVALGLLALIWFFIKGIRIKENRSWLLLLVWLIFVLWFPWLFSPRVVFYYHYLPIVPLLAILTAVMLDRLYLVQTKPRYLMMWLGLLVLLIGSFWVYYPVWVGLPINENYIFSLYGFLFSGRSLPGILLGIRP